VITVAFMSYVGEARRRKRHSLGIWVVMFLLVFTWWLARLRRNWRKDFGS